VTEKVIVGVIEEVNLGERYFVVNSTKIAIRGQWKGSDGVRYNWKEMLALFKVGERLGLKPSMKRVNGKPMIEKARVKGEHIDYITFVPDGEPTLDINPGREAELLKELGIPLAILTNSSLIWREDVREDLIKFGFVSLKLDVVSEQLWRKIDRLHKSLKLDEILDGMLKFRKSFKGKLITETMLIDGIN